MRALALVAMLGAGATGCDLVFGLSGGGGADAELAKDASGADGVPRKCFADDFEDGAIDLALWTPSAPPPTISEMNGLLVIMLGPEAAVHTVVSARTFELSHPGDGLQVDVVGTINQTAPVESGIQIASADGFSLVMSTGQSRLLMRQYEGGVLVDSRMLPWNENQYRHWRMIRNAAGDVEFTTSPDQATWQTQYLMAAPPWLATASVILYAASATNNVMEPGGALFGSAEVLLPRCER